MGGGETRGAGEFVKKKWVYEGRREQGGPGSLNEN